MFKFLPVKFQALRVELSYSWSWAVERFAGRPLSKSALIPRELFEVEKTYLVKLNGFHFAPYRNRERIVDKYGFIAFNGNWGCPATPNKAVSAYST